MSQPTPYNRQTSFTTVQQEAPTDPLPGVDLDAELNAVKTTLDQVLANLELIQRDDGHLANESVGRDQLATNIQLGFNKPEAWHSDVNYTTLDTVFFEGKFYSCLVSHLSSDFATDLAAGKWELIADFAGALGAAVDVAVTPSGNLSSTNVQLALEELQGDIDAINADGMMADPAVAPSSPATDDDSGRVATTSMVQARILEQLALFVPTGLGPLPYSGLTEPTGWCFANGQTFAKDAEPALWAYADKEVLAGNPLWARDATTVTVPNMKGLLPIGKDDMGGTAAAGRVTSAGSGLDGTVFGAIGGAEKITLTTAQIPSHTHTATVTDHGHIHGAPVNRASLSDQPGSSYGGGFATPRSLDSLTLPATTGISVSNANAGGGGSHSNMPPGVILNYIIKK